MLIRGKNVLDFAIVTVLKRKSVVEKKEILETVIKINLWIK